MSDAGAGDLAAGPGPWDRGLQPERTALAWQRTGLSAATAALVALRDGILTADPVVLGLSLVALAAAGRVLWSARHELDARVAALRAGRPLPSPAATPAAAVAVLALAGAVLAVALR